MKIWLIKLALKLFKFSWIKSENWNEQDRRALASFFNTGIGKKLHATIVNQSFAHDASATQQRDSLEWACGFASGYRACIASIQNLSANASPQESENDESNQTGGL